MSCGQRLKPEILIFVVVCTFWFGNIVFSQAGIPKVSWPIRIIKSDPTTKSNGGDIAAVTAPRGHWVWRCHTVAQERDPNATSRAPEQQSHRQLWSQRGGGRESGEDATNQSVLHLGMEICKTSCDENSRTLLEFQLVQRMRKLGSQSSSASTWPDSAYRGHLRENVPGPCCRGLEMSSWHTNPDHDMAGCMAIAMTSQKICVFFARASL